MRLLPHGEAGSWLKGSRKPVSSQSENFSIVLIKLNLKIRFKRNSCEKLNSFSQEETEQLL